MCLALLGNVDSTHEESIKELGASDTAQGKQR